MEHADPDGHGQPPVQFAPGLGEFLRLGEKYATTSPLSGSWSFDFGDDNNPTQVTATGPGTAKMTVQLLGYESLADYGLAVKVQYTLSMTGTFAFQYQGNDYHGTYSVSETQTSWCTPDAGQVKVTYSLSEKGAIAGQGSGSARIDATMLLT